jgi:Toprim domain
MNFLRMWAAGSTSQMKDFPVLAGVECLTILADNDENEASVKAASAAYWRWKDAGRDVRIRQPKERGDLNDIRRRVG